MSLCLTSARCGIAFVSIFVSVLAIAQPPDDGPVVANATDASLVWGACPAFMPVGCSIAVLHGDPAQPNVDVLFKVPGGSELPKHSHSSAERMVLISGELQVTYRDQPSITLRPGSYAYGPAGLVHDGKCLSAVPCVLFIAFEAPLDAIPATD